MPRFLVAGSRRAFTYEKYTFIPTGIGAYDDAAPDNGNVPPITIVRAVTPGSAADPAKAETHATAASARVATSTPNLLLMPLSLSRRNVGSACRSHEAAGQAPRVYPGRPRGASPSNS